MSLAVLQLNIDTSKIQRAGRESKTLLSYNSQRSRITPNQHTLCVPALSVLTNSYSLVNGNYFNCIYLQASSCRSETSCYFHWRSRCRWCTAGRRHALPPSRHAPVGRVAWMPASPPQSNARPLVWGSLQQNRQ